MNERLGYRNIMVGIGAALHFLVDCLCLCTLYLMSPLVETGYVVGLFIVYNVLAFVTQIITGHLADISRQKHWMLIISLLLLILGVATMAVGVNTLPQPSATAMLPTAILPLARHIRLHRSLRPVDRLRVPQLAAALCHPAADVPPGGTLYEM